MKSIYILQIINWTKKAAGIYPEFTKQPLFLKYFAFSSESI